MKKTKICIIGAGEIGKAIGSLFPKNSVVYWDSNQTKVKYGSLESSIAGAEIVFLCIPSWAATEVLGNIKKLVSKNTFVISLAKGLVKPQGASMDEMLSKNFSKNQFGILAGPMIAEEIMKQIPTFGILATTNKQIHKKLSQLIVSKSFSLQYTTDVRGAAMGGVIKNVYAVALGMADCLNLGYNTKAWLFTQMMKEMRLASKLFGGKIETFLGLAGLGDLIATGSSTDSRHFFVGHELIKYGKCSLNNEGLNSLPSLWKKVQKQKTEFPIINLIHKIVEGKANSKKTFLAYIGNGKTI